MKEDKTKMATQAESGFTREEVEDAVKELQVLREKILFTLEIYPFLGKSMIHQAIGSALPRGIWGPILEQLVDDGEVCITSLSIRTPLERNQTVHLYHLARNHYTPGHDNINIAEPGSIAPTI